MMRVLLNFALSADGKIGTHKGGASKFTSRLDLERLWEIRKSADAIMVGRGTLEADQMSLTIPEEASPERQPIRIVVTRRGCLNYEHPVFHKTGGDLHILCTENAVSDSPADVTAHQMTLADFLHYAKTVLGVKTLLCEGGGELVRSLAELGVITDIHLTLAGHSLIGGQHAPGILGKVSAHLPKSQRFKLLTFQENGEDELFLSYQRAE